jgi:hypothetical protein
VACPRYDKIDYLVVGESNGGRLVKENEIFDTLFMLMGVFHHWSLSSISNWFSLMCS